jgi:nanoRNase/pAp phosphatase (c-di-AMP/oligoRNAs hydrolase)
MLDSENQIFKQIEKSNNILVIFQTAPEKNSLAAALGLFLFLKNLNKTTDIVGCPNDSSAENHGEYKNPATLPFLSFLPAYHNIGKELENLRRFIVSVNIKKAKVNQIKYSVDNDQLNFIISPVSGWFSPEDVSARAGEFKYDLIITLGISDLESLGKIYDNNVEFFYKTTIINIDNQADNEEFGQINFLDLNSVANAELIYYLLKNYNQKLISEDVATCLLAGIIEKTKNFKTGNLTPRTLLAGSELIDLKARREEIINYLFYSKDLSSLKLWGEILNNLQSENKGEFLWSKINAETLIGQSLDERNLTEMVDELISSLPKVKVFVVLLEAASDETLIYAFSLKGLNASDFLVDYAGKGNSKMASGKTKQDLKTAEIETIVDLKNKLAKLTLDK